MTQQDKEKKGIINLYSAFGASLFFMLIPSSVVALVAALLMLGVLIVAYGMRRRSEAGSLRENHTTFIIRTIWIGSFLSLLTMMLASVYMLPRIDNTPLESCIQGLISNAAHLAGNEDMGKLVAITQPCMNDFLHINGRVFMVAMAITAIPVLLYFLIRFSRGLSRALGGYRIANPKNWF